MSYSMVRAGFAAQRSAACVSTSSNPGLIAIEAIINVPAISDLFQTSFMGT